MSPHPDPLPHFMYQYCCSSAGRGNGRGAMPFLMSFALEHEIVTLAWIDNASVQFPLNIYATKGKSRSRRKEALKIGICQTKMSVVTLAPTKSAVFPRTARIC